MSYPLAPRRLVACTIAILLGLGLTGTAWAQCQPATPCPCCADGMCYPKRDTWGNYLTNWRPWPGQTTGIAPTPEEERMEGVREQLPVFVRPRPDQEDLRGPARPVRPVEPGVQTEVNELPPADLEQPPVGGQQPPVGGEPAPGQQEAPPLDDAPAPAENLNLPGFGPQGALQPLPQIEDGPPSLPRGLSQVLTSHYQQSQNQAKPASASTTVTANANSTARPVDSSTVGTVSRGITPTAATVSIELTNPAAKNVQKTMDEDLHHAIYYEAEENAQK